jgi:hypothetical protein
MAKPTSVPAEHRSHAERVPEDIRDRLTDEELIHRSQYAAHLYDTAPHGEAGRAMMRHADRILRALPLAELIERRKELYEAADSMRNASDASDIHRAIAKLDKDNVYPSGMREAGEKIVHNGLAANYPDADLHAILGREAEKAKAPKLSGATPVEKALRDTASLSAGYADVKRRTDDLRKEINAYKAKIVKDYQAANMPIPPGFLSSPEQHPDMPRLRELEKSAEKYRDMANGITEHDLSEHYMNQARDYEDRAARLRSAIGASL